MLLVLGGLTLLAAVQGAIQNPVPTGDCVCLVDYQADAEVPHQQLLSTCTDHPSHQDLKQE